MAYQLITRDNRLRIGCNHHGSRDGIDISRLLGMVAIAPRLFNVASGYEKERPSIFFASSRNLGRFEVAYFLGYLVPIEPEFPSKDLLNEFLEYLETIEQQVQKDRSQQVGDDFRRANPDFDLHEQFMGKEHQSHIHMHFRYTEKSSLTRLEQMWTFQRQKDDSWQVVHKEGPQPSGFKFTYSTG